MELLNKIKPQTVDFFHEAFVKKNERARSETITGASNRILSGDPLKKAEGNSPPKGTEHLSTSTTKVIEEEQSDDEQEEEKVEESSPEFPIPKKSIRKGAPGMEGMSMRKLELNPDELIRQGGGSPSGTQQACFSCFSIFGSKKK